MKAFHPEMKPSRTVSLDARKAEYREPIRLTPKAQGVEYTYYEGNFSLTTDLLRARPVEKGVMSEPDIKNAKQEDHFGYIFKGYIFAPETGVYEFMTRSDDGSLLKIGDETVVNNEGSHAAIASTGKIRLEERRVGKEGLPLCRSTRRPDPL